MTQGMVIDILRNAFMTIIITSGPILLVALTIGLIISILQATTQIQEQTLSFVPKIVAVLLALIVFGSFIINTLITFTTNIFQMIPLIG